MKKLTIILITILMPTVMPAQFTPPGCNDLRVENIQMDNDTANLMKITISNSCTSCTSGINGCVYLQLQVIKTILPFDTIASSNCWCFWSPDNSSQKIYSINSTVTSLPAISNIRVSLFAGGCGCDTIPFNPALGFLSNEIFNTINVSPNPFVNDISITVDRRNVKQTSFLIRNILGQIVLSEQENNLNSTYKKTIDLSELAKGIYLLDVIIDGQKTVNKIVKE